MRRRRRPKSVCLVDHNALSARLFPESWQARVTRVIDHHEDTGMHADAVDRVIELIGSCSSLVYRDVVRVAGRDDVTTRRAFTLGRDLVGHEVSGRIDDARVGGGFRRGRGAS